MKNTLLLGSAGHYLSLHWMATSLLEEGPTSVLAAGGSGWRLLKSHYSALLFKSSFLKDIFSV